MANKYESDNLENPVKFYIHNLENNKRIVYRKIPLKYSDFLVLCGNCQIENYSIEWIDNEGKFNQIIDQFSYEQFLHLSREKKLFCNEKSINNKTKSNVPNTDNINAELIDKNNGNYSGLKNDIEKCTEYKGTESKLEKKKIDVKQKEEKLVEKKNDDMQPELRANKDVQTEINITELSIKKKNTYLLRSFTINDDLMQMIIKIMNNFNIFMTRTYNLFHDDTSLDLKEIVLEVLKNFNLSLLKIIQLAEKTNAIIKDKASDNKLEINDKIEYAKCLKDTKDQSTLETETSENKEKKVTDYAKIRQNFLNTCKLNSIKKMVEMGYKNDHNLVIVLNEANYNLQKAIQIYEERYNNENSINFNQLNID